MTDTLRSICEQCTHLNNPRLDFIPSQLTRHKEIILLTRHKEIILRDLRELVSVASNEHEKACLILAGSILKAILFTFLLWQEPQVAALKPGFTFDQTRGLRYYLRIFDECFRKDFPKLQLTNEHASYRDFVHINRELRAQPDECRNAALTLLRTLDGLIGELAAYGRGAP
jgi:hypothetical protein